MDFSFFFDNIVELTVTGLVLGSVYALIALGYTLVYGVLQLINFAHADVFMWGTFIVAWVFIAVGAGGSGTLLSAVPFLLLALVVASSATGGLAMLVERVAYRRLVRKRALSYIILISAIGASFVLSETMGVRDRIVRLLDGAISGLTGGAFSLEDALERYIANPRGPMRLPFEIKPTTVFSIGDFNVRDTDLTIVVAALGMMVALDFFIRRTRLGREIRAVAQDPEAAALMGANAQSVVSKTFLIGGLMAGMLYSLVALGFVLIYKASGVFNFAQGAMVLFAALAMARFSEWIPKWTGIDNAIVANLAAFVIAGVFMFVVAWVIERLVLRHLVNQEGATLLMATLGITYFLEGVGQTLFGSDIYKIDVGMPKDPVFLFESVFEGGVLVNKEDVIAAAIAATLVLLLSIFFQKTKTGRALRAVADDHQAAQSIGIPLNRIWVIVWCVAGVVALVAGMIWGSKLGVQFSLTTVALRALPVVILGGLTSVPGAIIGGLIIGVGEKLSEVYLGPFVGGGIEIWFAYVLALVFLLFRPQGLFGEKIIDRV